MNHYFMQNGRAYIMIDQLTLKPVRSWREIAAEVRQIEGIDSGIFEAVVVFNALGISTHSSCEGHLDNGWAAPYLVIGSTEKHVLELEQTVGDAMSTLSALMQQGRKEETRKLLSDIEPAWHALRSIHFRICQPVHFALALFYQTPFRARPDFDAQLTLLPSRWSYTGLGLLEPRGATQQLQRSDEARTERLARYQEELRNFTAFLKTFIDDVR
jgi:hypothetical protein